MGGWQPLLGCRPIYSCRPSAPASPLLFLLHHSPPHFHLSPSLLQRYQEALETTTSASSPWACFCLVSSLNLVDRCRGWLKGELEGSPAWVLTGW